MMKSATDSLIQVATIVTAVYGAGLSTYNFFLKRRDQKPRLRVSLSWGMLTTDRFPIRLLIVVTNPGQRKVRVSEVSLQLRDKRSIIVPGIDGTTPLPADLEIGTSASYFINPTHLGELLRDHDMEGSVPIRAFAREATGQRFFSREMTFDTEHKYP